MNGNAKGARPICRVLVADDHPPSRDLASQAMVRHRCEVVAVSDGKAALEAVQAASFGLVFLDVHMPRLGGLNAASEIRRWEAATGRPRTPIIALTASAMPHEQTACYDHGMDDVLLKPFRLAQLVSMLDKWCPS